MPASRRSGESDSVDWFSNAQKSVRFDRRALIRFGSELRRRLAGGREFGVRVASDDALRRANRRFRGNDQTADVLSFRDDEGVYLGDILISADRARAQARRLGHSVDEEMQILLLHGVLHLLGHDHERDNGSMARLERSWRRRLGLPIGLIERARS
jgi:probable rRNA maturation factor